MGAGGPFGGNPYLFGPILVTILVCLATRAPKPLILWLFLFVTLVADLVFLLYPGRGFSVWSFDFVRALIGVYPFALVTFSYPAPLLGCLGWYFLKRTSLATFLSRRVLYASCSVLGSALGALLMLVVTLIMQSQGSLDSAQKLYSLMVEWGVNGATCGAVAGLLVAVYSKRPEWKWANAHVGARRQIDDSEAGWQGSRW